MKRIAFAVAAFALVACGGTKEAAPVVDSAAPAVAPAPVADSAAPMVMDSTMKHDSAAPADTTKH